MLHQTFLFLGQLWQLFEVSQILEYLRYSQYLLLSGDMPHAIMESTSVSYFCKYRIYPAIRRGFCPSRMTSNNKISPMKFCYNTNFNLPKQSQRARSILQDGSRSLRLFWKAKTPSYTRRNTVQATLDISNSIYSKYPLIPKNIVWTNLLFFLTF